MDGFSIGIKLFLAFIIGAVIGLEREINEKKSMSQSTTKTAVLGIRSFSLITVLGAVAGLLYAKFIFLSIFIAIAFLLLLLIFYYFDNLTTHDYGLTTEIAGLWSFVLGILLAVDIFPIQIIFAITVIIALLLSQKDTIKNVVEDIAKRELNAFIGFALIAVVILPFLPNTSYALADIPGFRELIKNFGISNDSITSIELINPFKIWLIVALVTGVDLVGYVLERIVGGKKGWLITSIIGGFVSSTATTQSLAQESKSQTQSLHLVAAAVVANVVSFVQVAFLLGTLNIVFLVQLLPVLVMMILAGVGIVITLLLKKEKKQVLKKKSPTHQSIFDLAAAVKFACLFLAISVVSKISLALFGNTAFLLTTGIGALIGLDAVMINTAQLVNGQIALPLGVSAFLLANAVNLFAKSLYSYLQGSTSFAFLFSLSMAGIIVAGFGGYILSFIIF